MGTRINLLGAPGIEVDGVAVAPPRGAKSWAVLAYLVLTDRPVPRARLVDLLYDEADDPAAALRWSLSQLRRSLDGAGDLTGDPVRWVPADGTVVDVDVVLHASWQESLAMPGFGGRLLEGMSLRTGAAYELWLANGQRRVSAATAARLYEGAHDRLAHGDPTAAVDLATRLVACEPLVERGHELLIRALVAAGDRPAARARLRRCEELFRRELGRAPSPALSDAVRSRPQAGPPRSRAAVLAALDAGSAAAQAGAYDRAIEVLRGAVATAASHGDELWARAMVALGTVLVHGVRGSDEEAVGLLHRAFVAATGCGARRPAAQAARELVFVETLRAHYPRMERWFTEATGLADGDAALLAWVTMYVGLGRTDQGRYAPAQAALGEARELARSCGDLRVLAYALAGEGRLHLLREELEEARAALEAACATARDLGWTSFLPFPQSLLAEVDLRDGDLGSAGDGFEHSYALATEVGDPCWQSYAMRGRGLLAAAQGDHAAALEMLVEAPLISRRTPDTHDWVEGYCMAALCDFAVARGLASAPAWVDEAEEFASRRGMQELVARAVLSRVRLGQPGAREGLALLLPTIDNPALHLAAAAAA